MKLNASEADLLVSTIDQAIEGHRETKDLVATDPSIESPEDLVDIADQIDDTVQVLKDVRGRILDDASS